MVSDVMPKFKLGDPIDPNKKIEPIKDGNNNRENLFLADLASDTRLGEHGGIYTRELNSNTQGIT